MVEHSKFLEAIASPRDSTVRMPPGTRRRVSSSAWRERLDDRGRQAFASTMPNQLAGLVRDSAPLHRDEGKTPLLQTVGSELDTSPEQARFFAQAVLSAFADADAAAAETVRSQLPEDFGDLFSAPGQEPTDLTAEEVAGALVSLPGWMGDVHALERTVALPPGIGQEFRDRIARIEHAMNHRAVVQDRPDGTTFRLRTHARRVVTDLDVDLARRIGEVLEEHEGL